LFFAFRLSVEAQQPKKVPKIGFLDPDTPSSSSRRIDMFRRGLRELGYVEGQNIAIEYRYSEGKVERLAALAGELVRLKVDVIVTRSTPAVRAAKNTTNTIPIVMLATGDAVGSGFVSSLARPGGNITGMTNIAPELTGKQLELLAEIVPKLSRVALLVHDRQTRYSLFVSEAQEAGRSLGLHIKSLVVSRPQEFQNAFSKASKEHAGALLIQPFLIGGVGYGAEIAELALKNRLPTVSALSQFAEVGGLMSYGPDVLDLARRAAYHTDKILKGAKPAELPVQQPTKFELVINLKTAKQIDLTIPSAVLARADQVIR
jgi:putative ABC transport system substrate-binding protein